MLSVKKSEMEISRVMVVDDEPDLRELVKITLNRRGYEVTAVHDGSEALDRLNEEKPDLVLMDVNMPEMDGWETLEELEERGITEEVPIAMFTVEELTIKKMMRKDMENLAGYIEKPFDREDLIEVVEKIIKRTKETNELKKKIEESESNGSLARAFLAWNRTKMIHERILEKLGQLKWRVADDEKLAHIEELVKGEESKALEAERRAKEILKLAGLEGPISE